MSDHEAYAPKDYRVTYKNVAYRPSEVYGGAGTDDPEEAAKWYAAGVAKQGPVRHAAYQACFDVLTGRESRHP